MTNKEKLMIVHEYLSDWYNTVADDTVELALKIELKLVERMIEEEDYQ